MENRRASNIVITGFSGTGKSLVAREVARRLEWDFIDTDGEIVRQAKKPIEEIFKSEGEEKFRELEREAVRKACLKSRRVIAIGGGAIVDPQNRTRLARKGFIVCLEARPETIYRRLFKEAKEGAEIRPLLKSPDPLERIRRLKARRQPHYDNVDRVVNTDDLTIDEVAGEVVKSWRLLRRSAPRNDRKGARNDRKRARGGGEKAACRVVTATRRYPVFVGYGLLDELGEKANKAALSPLAVVISDENVWRLYGGRVEKVLSDAGLTVHALVVPPGEETKSLKAAQGIYDFLIKKRVERDDMLIALGGGMVGDLAGFVAATYLRGIPWLQVPTSLVAMVDASIGGKVGVNHPEGKNLIGAFYQPSLVLADTQALATLPERELTSGWAEVVKYGLIMDRELFEFLEENVSRLVKLEQEAVGRAVRQSAALKAEVVSQDEKERGRRTILNYGHTIAHGLEAATHYRRFLHGEAVAIGMMGAAKLSQRRGMLSPAVVKRQQSLLEKFGLPTAFSDVSRDEIAKAMEVDKKTRARKIRWVLLEDIGRTLVRADVPQEDVLAVLEELVKR